MYTVHHYLTSESKDIYFNWQRKIRNQNARIAIDRRINRIEMGNFGDCKFCRDGVYELRINVGVGYRVYYAISGEEVILLLCGGDKSTQDADIQRACDNWQDWKRRSNEER